MIYSHYLPHLPQDKNAAILDLGCGFYAPLTYWLLNHKYKNITAVDKSISPYGHWAFEIARMDILEFVDRAIAKQLNYDCIILKDSLYYFDAAIGTKLLTRLKELLSTNGKILIEVINGASFTGAYTTRKDLDIRILFTDISLTTMLSRANLKFTMYAIYPDATTWRRKLFSILQFAWRSTLKFLYFLERGNCEQNPKVYTTKMLVVATPPENSLYGIKKIIYEDLKNDRRQGIKAVSQAEGIK